MFPRPSLLGSPDLGGPAGYGPVLCTPRREAGCHLEIYGSPQRPGLVATGQGVEPEWPVKDTVLQQQGSLSKGRRKPS